MRDLADTITEALGNRYQVRRELGRGGRATVFLARDVRHERDVALKVLREDLRARSEKRYVAAFDTAIIEHALGLHDEALASLARAIDERSVWLMWTAHDPLLDAMRSDERYTAVLARVAASNQ